MFGISLGGGKSKNSSSSSFEEDVFAPQANALGGLYSNANQAYSGSKDIAGQMQSMAPEIQQQMAQYANQANMGFGNQMSGGGMGNTGDLRTMLAESFQPQSGPSNTQQMYESIVGGSGNTYVDPMVDAMKRSGMDNLNRMQANTGLDAAAMGQGGSSRHAMQNAMQAGNMNQQMLDREMNMRGNAYDRDLDLKMGIAEQADTNALNRTLGTQENLMRSIGMGDQNTQAAMQFAPTMQNLGMGTMAPWQQAMNAPWDAMQSYSNVIGAPTVLGEGESKGKGSSWGISGSASMGQ